MQRFRKELDDYEYTTTRKSLSNPSYKKETLESVVEITVMSDNNPTKSVKCVARYTGMTFSFLSSWMCTKILDIINTR